MDTGIKVGDCMKTALVTIGEDASSFDAARKMAEHKVGCLLVEKGGKITGIVTDSDLIKKCLATERVYKKISEIASKNLVGVGIDADLSEAARVMGQKKIRRLVIQKSGRVVGIISESDIVGISPSLYDLIAQKQALQARA